MARRSASRGRASSSNRSSKKRSSKAYEDDDLIIEDEAAEPARRSRSKKSARSSTTRSGRGGSSSRGASSKRASGGSGGGGGGRKRRGGPPAKKNNNDQVIYVVSGVSLFILVIVIYLVFANSGGTEFTDDSQHIKQAKEMLKEAQKYEGLWHKAESSGNESDRQKYIRKARKYAQSTLEAVNELRENKRYMIDEDTFKPDYQWVEDIEQKAGTLLHDIAKQSHASDF